MTERRLTDGPEPLPGVAPDDALPQKPRPRHLRRVVLGGGIVVALVALGVLGATQEPDGADGGGTAADFELPRLDEEGTLSLRQFRGRPVVLNFWASWCVPCRKEMPAFQAAAERIGDRAAFIGINHQDSRDGAIALLRDSGVRYPSAYDPDGKVAQTYGLFGMPTTVFISPSGDVLEKHTGELSAAALDRLLARHFGM